MELQCENQFPQEVGDASPASPSTTMTMGRIISKLVLSKLIPKFEDFDWLTVKLVLILANQNTQRNQFIDDSAL